MTADGLNLWQMELPLVWLADVIAMVADGMATVGMSQCIKADVITLLADVIAIGLYFNLSSVLLTRTSSHIWGRWHLPMFLFRDGLLTLMYIDSLINLERLCSSLPTILKLLSVMEWPVMLLWSYIGHIYIYIYVAIPSATMAIKSANLYSSYNICHKHNII